MTFPSAETAEAARGDYGLTVFADGRHWLFTLGPVGAGHPGGEGRRSRQRSRYGGGSHGISK